MVESTELATSEADELGAGEGFEVPGVVAGFGEFKSLGGGDFGARLCGTSNPRSLGLFGLLGGGGLGVSFNPEVSPELTMGASYASSLSRLFGSMA